MPLPPFCPPSLPQVDPTSALRTLDMGPPADKADAAKAFRAFWGNKAELRRFQDGAITEAVVWEDGGAAERHLIVDRWAAGGRGWWVWHDGARAGGAACLRRQAALPCNIPAESHALPPSTPPPCHSIMVHIAQRHLPAGTIVSCHAGAMDAALRRKHSTLDVDVQVVRLCEAAAERLGCVQPPPPLLSATAAAAWLRALDGLLVDAVCLRVSVHPPSPGPAPLSNPAASSYAA